MVGMAIDLAAAAEAAGEAGLALAFAYAAGTKFYDRERFTAVLTAGGLGPGAARAAAVAVPAAEVAVAAGIVVGTPTSQRVALAVLVAMLGGFNGWLVHLDRRRVRVPCRCFGSDAQTRLGQALVRNAVLAAVAVLCLGGDGPLPLAPTPLSLSVVVGAVVVLWASYGVVVAWPALLKRPPGTAGG